jgi:hypothetical protein
MSRYRGPRLRVTRRLGDLPGLTRKSARRAYPPGQHGQARKKKSEYCVRLEEKQKLRFNYGLSEKQLRRYVQKARRAAGSTGLVLLQLLEMRLDNTVFRMGMAPTIPGARQLVTLRLMVESWILPPTNAVPAKRSPSVVAKPLKNWWKQTFNTLVCRTFPVTLNSIRISLLVR